MHMLHVAVTTRIKGLLPAERAVVRRADSPPRGVAATEPVRLRLLAEGAVISAVRCVIDCRVVAGLDLGRWHGSDKATLRARSPHVESHR
jgi:hypothetical protein